MENNIYVVVSVTDQNDYTESRYFESAQPARENRLVSTNYAAAECEAKKLKLADLESAKVEEEEYSPKYEWEPEEYTDPRHVEIETWKDGQQYSTVEILDRPKDKYIFEEDYESSESITLYFYVPKSLFGIAEKYPEADHGEISLEFPVGENMEPAFAICRVSPTSMNEEGDESDYDWSDIDLAYEVIEDLIEVYENVMRH